MRRSAIGAVTLVLLWTGVAAGHAYLKASDPPEETTINAAPNAVRLIFTEPVEIRFSIFKVYRLDIDPGMEMRRVNAAAGALMSNVLQKRGDEADRADAGVDAASRTTTDVAIKLKPELKAGSYVVMWRVLSIDTHTTQGFFVFMLAPRP
ncbi:MAG: copper resistance CopC family protein [Armatimonadota bacterium]